MRCSPLRIHRSKVAVGEHVVTRTWDRTNCSWHKTRESFVCVPNAAAVVWFRNTVRGNDFVRRTRTRDLGVMSLRYYYTIIVHCYSFIGARARVCGGGEEKNDDARYTPPPPVACHQRRIWKFGAPREPQNVCTYPYSAERVNDIEGLFFSG